MDESKQVYIGTDCGATMSKVGGVWADGTTVSTKLHQRPTNSQAGQDAVVAGWIAGDRPSTWGRTSSAGTQVSSVGLAIPGPYQRYGVLGRSANMPASFEGWDFYTAYSQALAKQGGRAVPLVVGTTAPSGASARPSACAARRRGGADAGARLGPRLGLHRRARPAAPGGHAGRAWRRRTCRRRCTCSGPSPTRAAAAGPGVASSSTPRWPGCPTCWPSGWRRCPTIRWRKSTETPKQKALALRGLAQKGDALAVELFDFQARAMGLHIANLVAGPRPGVRRDRRRAHGSREHQPRRSASAT